MIKIESGPVLKPVIMTMEPRHAGLVAHLVHRHLAENPEDREARELAAEYARWQADETS